TGTSPAPRRSRPPERAASSALRLSSSGCPIAAVTRATRMRPRPSRVALREPRTARTRRRPSSAIAPSYSARRRGNRGPGLPRTAVLAGPSRIEPDLSERRHEPLPRQPVRQGVRMRVEPGDPPAHVVPVRRVRRAEVNARDALLTAEREDLIVELGELIGAGREPSAQVREQGDGQRRVVVPALPDEIPELVRGGLPVRAVGISEAPVH